MNRAVTARGPRRCREAGVPGRTRRISLPPRSIHPAREGPRPPGGMLRRRCRTARRPTLTAARSAALHSAPRLRRPGRAAFPFRFREPGRRDRPSGCRHARALARRHGRRRRLRFAPRSCDGSRRGPKDLKALRSPELRQASVHLNLPVPPSPASGPTQGKLAPIPTPSLKGPPLALNSAVILLSRDRPLSLVTSHGFSMELCFKIQPATFDIYNIRSCRERIVSGLLLGLLIPYLNFSGICW